MSHLILVSTKSEDSEFAVEVARMLGIKVSAAASKEKLYELFHSQTGCTVLMDFDPLVERESGFREFQEMALQIEKMKAWHRVIAISGYGLNDIIALGKFTAYSKYLLRNFTPQAIEAYALVINNMMIANPFDAMPAGVDELQVQRTRISNSARKKSALEALTTILEKKTLPPRVSKAVVRATDEMILNAIFDAPMDMSGKRYKHGLDRGSEYALNQLSKREEVEVEMISTKGFLLVSVTDFFGSLKKEEYLPLLEKHFHQPDVETTGTEVAPKPASGLGLYLTVTTGLSIQILIDPGKRTKVSVMVPWVENVRELKYAFRFFCLKQK